MLLRDAHGQKEPDSIAVAIQSCPSFTVANPLPGNIGLCLEVSILFRAVTGSELPTNRVEGRLKRRVDGPPGMPDGTREV
jgi:hypothetical protein